MDTESEVERIMLHPWQYAGLPPREPSALKLSAWSNYSLGVWSTWTVFFETANCFLRRIEWARRMDSVRVGLEAPTTFGAESPIPVKVAENFLVQAKLLLETPRAPDLSGLVIDGVCRRILVRTTGGEVNIAEWRAGDASSNHLDSWVEEASVAMDNLLVSSSAQGANRAI